MAQVLCTPLDDELTYEYNRNPNFWQLTFSSAFKKRLALWNALNVLRTVCVGLAWLLVSPVAAVVAAAAAPAARDELLFHAVPCKCPTAPSLWG
jgi:hypothetical protein